MINFKPILFTLGLTLSKLALFMWMPTLLAFFTGTPGLAEFLAAVILTHIAAFICLHVGHKVQFRLGVRDMFVLTSAVWVVACVFGALPFVFINQISFTDAYFETMSGVTTTGSTVLTGLDNMAPSILLWRSLLQWLGGVGFIVLAVAVLPALNVGGIKLFQIETSDNSEKDTPRAANVAKNMDLVSLVLILLCCHVSWPCGMSAFEAINHAMTTLSTGGFSTSDASMAHFSNASQWVGSAFMFLGGLPFLLYVQTLRRRQLVLFHDAQVRGFFWLVLVTTTLMSLWIWYQGVFPLPDAIRISLFNIVSVLTTTGYGLTDFGLWSHFTTILFIFLMLVGACSGSTAGGMKIFRFQVASALFQKQARQLMHPSGVFPQKYNGRPVSDHIVRSIVAFVLSYMAVIIISSALLGLLGLTPLEAISGSVTAISNVGPGMGPVIGPLGNFASLPDAAKWILAFDMMLGRLEILTVAVLFFPSFWRN